MTGCSNPRTESLTSDASEDGERRRMSSREYSSKQIKGDNKGGNKGENHNNNNNNNKGDYYTGEQPRRNSINARLANRIGKSAKQHSTSSSKTSSHNKEGRAASSSSTQTPVVYYNQDACRSDRPRQHDGAAAIETSTRDRAPSKSGSISRRPRSRHESENQIQQPQPQQYQQQPQQHQQPLQHQQQQHHPPLKETSWKSFDDRSPTITRNAQTCPRPQSAHAVSMRNAPPSFGASATSSMSRDRNSSTHEVMAFKVGSPEQKPDLSAIRRQRVHSVHLTSLTTRVDDSSASASKPGRNVSSLPFSRAAGDVPPPIPPRAQRPNSATPTSKSASATPTSKPTSTTPPVSTPVSSTTPTAKTAHRLPPPPPKDDHASSSTPPIRHPRLASVSPASDSDVVSHLQQQPTKSHSSSKSDHDYYPQQQQSQQSVRPSHSRRGLSVAADVDSEVTVVRPTSNLPVNAYYPEISVMSTGHSTRLSSSDGRDPRGSSSTLQHPLIRVRDHFLQESLIRSGESSSLQPRADD